MIYKSCRFRKRDQGLLATARPRVLTTPFAASGVAPLEMTSANWTKLSGTGSVTPNQSANDLLGGKSVKITATDSTVVAKWQVASDYYVWDPEYPVLEVGFFVDDVTKLASGLGISFGFYADPVNTAEYLYDQGKTDASDVFELRTGYNLTRIPCGPVAELAGGTGRPNFIDGATAEDFAENGIWKMTMTVYAAAGQTVNVWLSDVRPVKPQGKVIFMFDDESRGSLLADRILEHYGWRNAHMIYTRGVAVGNNMTWAEIAAEAARGHVIACHGHNHDLGWSTATVAQMTADLTTAFGLLRQHGYAETCQYFATPGGQTSANARQVARSLAKCLREASTGGCTGLPGRDPFTSFNTTALVYNKLEEAKTTIDVADSYGATLFLLGHILGVTAGATVMYPWQFDAICRHIQSKSNLVVTDLHTFWQNEMTSVQPINLTLGSIAL